MGRLLLISRLAARNLRRRPGEAALLLLAITGATTILTLGLVLYGVTRGPYESTRKATAGPDVVAEAVGQITDRDLATKSFPTGPIDVAGLMKLAKADGVVSHTGPYPVYFTTLRAGGQTLEAQVQGRDAARAD